ncbi:MAG: hypothetical protein WC340_05975 [Kiritimatiellia bacterium]
MMKIRHKLWLVAATCLIWGAPSFAWDLTRGIEASVPSERIPSFYLILVVSAERLNPEPHTNENPPTGIFTVHERIRGYLKEDRVAAQWHRMPSEEDVLPWAEGMPDMSDRVHWFRPGKPEWNRIPVPAPDIGKKIIIFAQVAPSCERSAAHFALSAEPDLTLLRVRGVFDHTEANVAILRQHMGRTDWPPFVMGSLWLAVVVLAIGAAGRLATSFAKDFADHTRRLKLGGILFVASLVLWVLFEYGNVTGGIRVDLLLLFPLFFLDALVLLGSGGAWARKQRKRERESAGGDGIPPPQP